MEMGQCLSKEINPCWKNFGHWSIATSYYTTNTIAQTITYTKGFFWYLFSLPPSFAQSCQMINYRDLSGLPGGTSGKETTCQCRRHRFNPWVRKIPWRRKWQPTLVFSPEKSHGRRSLGVYTPWGCKRVGDNLATTQQLVLLSTLSQHLYDTYGIEDTQ